MKRGTACSNAKIRHYLGGFPSALAFCRALLLFTPVADPGAGPCQNEYDHQGGKCTGTSPGEQKKADNPARDGPGTVHAMNQPSCGGKGQRHQQCKQKRVAGR